MKKSTILFALLLSVAGGAAFAEESPSGHGHAAHGQAGHHHPEHAKKNEAASKEKKSPVTRRNMAANEIGKEAVCPVTGEKFTVSTETVSVSYKGKAYYFCCPGCDKSFKANPEKYAGKKPAAAGKIYACPMGDYQGDKPGKCPKCGMDLVEKQAPQAKTYICPMGCAGSESDKPGKCPKCGMNLVEKKAD